MSDYIGKSCFPGLKFPPEYCIRRLPDVAYEQMHYYLAIRGLSALPEAEYLKYFTLCGSRSTMMAFGSGKAQVSFLKSAMIIHTLNFAFQDVNLPPYELSPENLEIVAEAKCLLSHVSKGMESPPTTNQSAMLHPAVHPNGETISGLSSSVSLPKPTTRVSAMHDSGLHPPDNDVVF